ncbi:hypothetical protein J7M31_01515 [Bifidobacterium longum]|uniref:hypothetical protein n=1 Tax=Bifidobacterium longum TaxID=216816 RepID=UPI001AD99334|nr:hypothetical protein [Bifidobacterium longum]QTL68910.1 hypothetical protein J7M31_01515 [Bifidobacterium longum]QTL76051.1 hypothetical protein J7M33_01515 [Bifidobacterium longum]
MMRLVIIGGCKIAAVAIGLLSALTGLWWLVAADIALYALCVVAVLPSVLLAVGLCAFWRWLWDDDDERSRYGYGY